MNIFDKIKQMSNETNNSYIEKAKAEGKKVIGYFCSFVPEEIITAAGFVPYRMRGVNSGGTEIADSYYSTTNCSFPRNILNKMLKGEYDFLDGIVFMNSCDHTRRMYDLWKHARPDEKRFIHFLDVPHKSGDINTERYIDVLNDFIAEFEKYFDVKITPENLEKAISLHNERRRLLQSINKLRMNKELPIKGSEYLALMLCVTAMPVEDSIELLNEVIDNMKNRIVSNDKDLRLIITGGCLEDIEHIELIESAGTAVVSENFCLGEKYSDMLVAENSGGINSIAIRYLEHLACARMTNGYQKRLDSLSNAFEKYKADGIIFGRLTFCILYEGEMYMVRKECEKQNIPLLELQRDYNDKGEGQIKTRVQAFVEKLQD